MAEEEIIFDSEGLKIEGLLENLQGEMGVVVTHPHPLYGGEMRNNVVESITQAYREQGYSTLRFNFRGVGKSEGSYEDGKGEQNDVRAALNFFSGLGKRSIDLAGYSFGAWVNALGMEKLEKARRIVMVSPPVNFVNFDFLKYNPKIQLAIVGNRDEIAGYKTIEKLIPEWNPEAILRIIEGADHFYGGYTDVLKSIISEFLEKK
ncbi:MAG: alpha/beta hydrolase [Desulfobacteraceae bacterium]|nr:alpha/beta hydrolase [Desulfobacteraceae bacterium]